MGWDGLSSIGRSWLWENWGKGIPGGRHSISKGPGVGTAGHNENTGMLIWLEGTEGGEGSQVGPWRGVWEFGFY